MVQLWNKFAFGNQIINEIQYSLFEVNGERRVCADSFKRSEIEATHQLPDEIGLIYIAGKLLAL